MSWNISEQWLSVQIEALVLGTRHISAFALRCWHPATGVSLTGQLHSSHGGSKRTTSNLVPKPGILHPGTIAIKLQSALDGTKSANRNHAPLSHPCWQDRKSCRLPKKHCAVPSKYEAPKTRVPPVFGVFQTSKHLKQKSSKMLSPTWSDP